MLFEGHHVGSSFDNAVSHAIHRLIVLVILRYTHTIFGVTVGGYSDSLPTFDNCPTEVFLKQLKKR